MGIQLSLHKKDYGLPTHHPIMKDSFFKADERPPYKATYKIIKDNPRLSIRRGDLIHFSKDSQAFRENLRGESGVILDRYKIIKEKTTGTYVDFYAIVMITSGESKGELYNVCPFNLSRLFKYVRRMWKWRKKESM